MGIQFYHFDAYSRIESKSKAKEGKSIYSVVEEAERTPGYCDHVDNPKKPVLLFGVPFSDVKKLAEEYAENTFDSKGRAVRKNGLCAIFGVVSAPHDMTEKVWEAFKKANIEYLQKTWGDNLVSVIEHTDEYFEPDPGNNIKHKTLHRHLHSAIIPSIGVNLAEIHPGIKAKRAADKAYGITKKPEGLDEKSFEIFKKKGRKAGDQAYRQAMRAVQDDFFINVGDPFGLLRYGPKRLRLTREEIKKRDHEKRLKQKNAVDLFEQEEKAKEQAAEIEKSKNELEKLLSKKQGIEDNLKSREKAVSDSEEAIKKREIFVAFAERRQADFESGLKTSLKGWQLPASTFGEFAEHYIKRVAGEVMGKVQRAMNLIKEYKQKKEELEKEKTAFEEEKKESQRQETARIAQSEKIHSEKTRRIKAAYEKLKNKILAVKTSQELTSLKKELSGEKQHNW